MKNRLLQIAEKRKSSVQMKFVRYLYHEIDWDQQLILIKGARGTGKTTLLLQRYQQYPEKAIYLSLDDFYFESNRLLLLIEDLYHDGYRQFFLDEVHQYEHWSKDLKNLYDNYDDIKIVATGSSALKLESGKADLSRRMSVYQLHGLSFREFIEYETGIKIAPVTLNELLENHQQLSSKINDLIDSLKLFADYLKYGYYPFYKKEKKFYHQKLQQIIQLTLDIDLPSVENINFTTIKGMKNLLYILSQIVPYKPNIQSLATKIDSQRNFVLMALDLLEKSSIINLLRSDNQNISYLQKPEKIFLENPNLAYVFSENNTNSGNVRETFFLNQLKVKHDVTAPKYGDFIVDQTYTFEIGGATKTKKQITGVPLAYIAADNIEYGSQDKIPLWLLGFLY
ncbi:MAG: ATP-binding protein [Ignavibacteria bacterium]|nr:ATP-binding protein [Ignavibacteria bacterium]